MHLLLVLMLIVGDFISSNFLKLVYFTGFKQLIWFQAYGFNFKLLAVVSVFVCVCVCMPSRLSHFNHVQLFETLWTVALQAPLSMGFSRQEYWSG